MLTNEWNEKFVINVVRTTIQDAPPPNGPPTERELKGGQTHTLSYDRRKPLDNLGPI